MRAFAMVALLSAERGRGAQGDEGYWVERDPGVRSFMPRDTFDRLAKPDTELLSFSQALLFLKAGRRVRRSGWGSDEGSLEYHDGHLRQLDSSLHHVQLLGEDLLADDWRVV